MLYWVLFAANIVASIGYNFVLLYVNWVFVKENYEPLYNPFWFWAYTITHYSVGALQLVSGIYLLVAVYLIRKFLVDQGMRNQVDYQSMTIHAVSFSLYNFAIIVLYVGYFIYLQIPLDAPADYRFKVTRYCLIAWIGTTYTNFAAQLCLIWIFLQFRNKSENFNASPRLSKAELETYRNTVVRIEDPISSSDTAGGQDYNNLRSTEAFDKESTVYDETEDGDDEMENSARS